ncbi:hypothetical protein BDY24DRAFT_401278 [Mrakia frigida]|uniref:uncharacterized protein n=1 Tax=Mrakia frigida TaxID=29902 RepID=UPI003FCC146E
MSINDASRTFNPSAQAQAQAPPQTSAQLPPPPASAPPPSSATHHTLAPTPTPTATAPPPQPTQATQAPLASHGAHHEPHGQGVAPGTAVGGGAGSVPSSGGGLGDGLYPISAFVLKQGGAYQAYVTVRWTTSDGRSGVTERLGSSIGFNHTGSRSLRQKGIPEGARVKLSLDVTLGKHSDAHEEFIFDSRALTSAFYTSGGTSLTIEKLHLVVADNDDA